MKSSWNRILFNRIETFSTSTRDWWVYKLYWRVQKLYWIPSRKIKKAAQIHCNKLTVWFSHLSRTLSHRFVSNPSPMQLKAFRAQENLARLFMYLMQIKFHCAALVQQQQQQQFGLRWNKIYLELRPGVREKRISHVCENGNGAEFGPTATPKKRPKMANCKWEGLRQAGCTYSM